MKIKFTKMQAYGNDYVYIDAINQILPSNLNKLARFVSDRHFGVGSDGMVLICKSEIADFKMRMFNLNGTEAQMCGNALRSVAKYVYEYGFTKKENFEIETLAGIKKVRVFIENGKVNNIQANIGKPILDPKLIPVNTQLNEYIEQLVHVIDRDFKLTAISWGNPHCVVFVDKVDDLDVEKYGKAIELNIELFPEKTNVSFVEVIDRNNIKMREWERGTGETIGCGTGCSASVVACVLTNKTERKVIVHQIGGPLEILWDNITDELYMKGNSNIVFESEIDVS